MRWADGHENDFRDFLQAAPMANRLWPVECKIRQRRDTTCLERALKSPFQLTATGALFRLLFPKGIGADSDLFFKVTPEERFDALYHHNEVDRLGDDV